MDLQPHREAHAPAAPAPLLPRAKETPTCEDNGGLAGLSECPLCGSLDYWFDGRRWKCARCAPGERPSVTVHLHYWPR